MLLTLALPPLCLAQESGAGPAATASPDVAAASALSPLSGSIAVVSDYVGRGLTFSNGQGVLQAQAEYEFSANFYGGLAFTNRADILDKQTIEVDLDAGHRARINDWTIDTAIDAWLYPGGRFDVSGNAYNIVEVTLDVSYRWVGVKLWYDIIDYLGLDSSSAEPNYGVAPHGSSAGSAYFDLHASVPLLHGLSLKLHAGQQFIRNYSALNYTDWLIGLEQQLPRGFVLGTAYTNTDANETLYMNPNGLQIGRRKVYAYISWSFP